MSDCHRRVFLLALALWLLAPGAHLARAADPCLEQALELARSEGGIGGTGLRDEGGIGGTGLEEGGIGGTGLEGEGGIGGTGIFGTVTGFGSLCVNGLRVELGSDVAVERRGAPASTDELAVGQVVWIEAESGPDGLHAHRIRVFSAALGVVQELDAEQGLLRVGEQWARVLPRAVLFDAEAGRPIALEELAPGDFVDVSGLYAPDGSLLASRVERRPPTAASGVGVPGLSALLRAAPELSHLSLESFVAGDTLERRLRIDGLELELAPGARLPLEPSARVWVQARTGPEGRLRAERIVPLRPPALPERLPRPLPDPVRDAPDVVATPPESGPEAGAKPAPTVEDPFAGWAELELFGTPKPVDPGDTGEPVAPGLPKQPSDRLEPGVRPGPVRPAPVPPSVRPAPVDLTQPPSVDAVR